MSYAVLYSRNKIFLLKKHCLIFVNLICIYDFNPIVSYIFLHNYIGLGSFKGRMIKFLSLIIVLRTYTSVIEFIMKLVQECDSSEF